MIRHPAGHDLLLITQADHATLSGFLAGRVGNETFDALPPEVVAAVAAHDGGWPLHDDHPTLNPGGLPLHVFETPPALSTRIWSASAERAADLGDYAALLVSLHQLDLSDLAIRSQSRPHSPRDVFELNKFQHKQIERQEQSRRRLGMGNEIPLRLGLAAPGANAAEDCLRFHFRLLTLCDRLSLNLCCGKPLSPEIGNVRPRPGGEPLSIHSDMSDDKTLRVGPWPFDAECLVINVPCRRLQSGPFENEDAFRSIYEDAPETSIQFHVSSK